MDPFMNVIIDQYSKKGYVDTMLVKMKFRVMKATKENVNSQGQ